MVDVRTMLQFVNREEEERAAEKLAREKGLEYVSLIDYKFSPYILHLIPEEMADKYFIIAYLKVGNRVKVATTNPDQPGLKEFLQDLAKANDFEIDLVICSPTSFRYSRQLQRITEKQLEEEQKQEEFKETIVNIQSFGDKQELAKRLAGATTTQLLDILFAGALALKASDIHLEPKEKSLAVRLRIDGVLQDIVELSVEQYRLLRSRVKYLSKLKLNVTDRPQDGRFEYRTSNNRVDVRVSAIPTPFGETFVMRLLQAGFRAIKLEELGFTPKQIETIRKAISRPNGIIINTGPTGSGKTTTLYAILSELNQPGVKIITIEDPIEYKIEGITQTQVEAEAGYDFASALRSALRQDPDIIMIGEIRDPETANIAVNAAVTGHLVLTTLHTNSAAAAIPRLIDMGAKTYLLGGTINLIIAQRLVRRLVDPNATGNDRYSGRIAIAEMLVPNDEINTLIQQKASVKDFEQAALRAGMASLYDDGTEKIKAGITDEEEVKRVALDVEAAK